MPKTLMKFEWSHSQRWRQIEVGYRRLKWAIFDQYLALFQKQCKIET